MKPKRPSLIPGSNLLEQFEGIETGLRKIQKAGRVGQYGFLFTAILQILFGLLDSGVVTTPAPGSTAARVIKAIRIASLVVLPLFLLLFAWSKFWLRQSRQPFRYTCRIEPILPLPHSATVRELAWLDKDLEELLSQRVERIRFVKASAGGSTGQTEAGAKLDESHIDIGGAYVVRARDDQGEHLVLEIMPSIGIGSGNPSRLAYPVSYPPDPISSPLKVRKQDDQLGEIELKYTEYKALLERVYSSVATEIYQQIQTDVAEKIELMPTRFLRAQALFHEAEDYARSNTLHGYAEAGRLYEAAARLFDPGLGPLPVSPFRQFFARLFRWRGALTRRALTWLAHLQLGFARRDIICARAQTGYVNMLLYRGILASISGQKIDPAFEAHRVALDALARLQRLPPDAPGCRKALFDAHVSMALACNRMDKREDAEAWLEKARSLDPAHERDIRFQMVRSELAPREKQAFRHLLNLAPRWETAQWSVAFEAERQWRARPALEKSLAGIPLLEYQNVIDLNPGNVGAWANRGYLYWLLEKNDEANGCFRAGRDYKQIKQETFVAELDYGLARIAAEQGDLQEAYCCKDRAISDLIAPTRSQLHDLSVYYFELVGDAVLDRFEQYRKAVENHLANAVETKGLPTRILNSVYAFVLNDYGECCNSYYERTGDARYSRKSEEAFELASLFDAENPLALYNLRQLRVRDLPTPGRKTEEELEKEIAAAEAQIAAAQKERAVVPLPPQIDSAPDEKEIFAEQNQIAAAQDQRDTDVTRARIAKAQAQIGDAQNEKEIAAAKARMAHAQRESGEITVAAPGAGQHRAPDVRDALQQEINSARERIRKAQEQIDEARRQIVEARRYDQKIRELHPYWTVGMLRETEMNALEAFIARRDASQEESAARKSKSASDRLAAEQRKQEHLKRADELQQKVKRKIRTLVPHHWLWSADGDFSWQAIHHRDPLNERRWEKQFNEIHIGALTTYAVTLTLSAADRERGSLLLDHISQTYGAENLRVLKRLRDLSTEEVGRTHSDYDRKVRALTERWLADDPYSFSSLWWIGANPFTDHEKLKIFANAADRPDLNGSLYQWLGEVQLLKIADRTRRKRAMLEPVFRKMQALSEQLNFCQSALAKPAQERSGLADSLLDQALAELNDIQAEEFDGNGIDEDELDRLQLQVQRILQGLDATTDLVGSQAKSGSGLANATTCEETFQQRQLRLKDLLERYRAMERQCEKSALQALTNAAAASTDPEILWDTSAQLANFGAFELALAAATTAARIDKSSPADPRKRETLDEAVRSLVRADLAIYSQRFREFVEIYRQPPARARTTTDYLRRRCALLALLEKIELDEEPFAELRKCEERWRTAIATEIGDLIELGNNATEASSRLADGRTALQKWVRQESKLHANSPAELADCRMAEIVLASIDARGRRDGTPTLPGAKSLVFLPAVTPIALEYESRLLGGDESPDLNKLIEILFPQMRERIAEHTGLTVPGVRMRANNTDMPPDTYLIMINEIPLVMGTAYRERVFVRGAYEPQPKQSWQISLAPGTGFPPEGEWRDQDKTGGRGRGREPADVWDHLEYITRHLEFIVRLNLIKFFGVQETANKLDEWLETELPADAAQHIRRVREDHHLLLQTSRQLQSLLQDRVPLTQPARVVTGLFAASVVADPIRRRVVLRDSLREQLWGNDTEFAHYKLSPALEAMLTANSLPAERFSFPSEDLWQFFSALRTELYSDSTRPALVTQGEGLRYFVRHLIKLEWPEVPVLADHELIPPLGYDDLPMISLE